MERELDGREGKSNQEAAKWGLTKWGLSDASASDDSPVEPPAIADKTCVLSPLVCVLHPVLLCPVLWHGNLNLECRFSKTLISTFRLFGFYIVSGACSCQLQTRTPQSLCSLTGNRSQLQLPTLWGRTQYGKITEQKRRKGNRKTENVGIKAERNTE